MRRSFVISMIVTCMFMQTILASAESEFSLAVPESVQDSTQASGTEGDTSSACTGPYCASSSTKDEVAGVAQQAAQASSAFGFPAQNGGKSAPAKTTVAAKGKVKAKTAVVVAGESSGMPSTTRDGDDNSQVAIPEVIQRTILSRSDVNRIVCREPIKDIFYSEERGVEKPVYSGNNAFIKLRFEKAGDTIEYAAMPIDLTIICGDTVYTLIGFPKPVPAQTIRLESGKKVRARANMALFKDQPERAKAKALMERLYHDDIPSTFEVKTLDKPLVVLKDVQTVLHKIITVEGEGLVAKEFYVVPLVDNIELNERDFLRKEFTETPFAIGFSDLKPSKGERSRLFIVETHTQATVEDVHNGQ